MIFQSYIGIKPETIDYNTARHTVKGVAIKGNTILMLESNRGDYTFPGGGIEVGETHQEALLREVSEETGYNCNAIGRYIGRIDLRREDIFEKDKMYELISHYYTMDVTSSIQGVKLTEGEKKFGLKPLWIDIDEVIRRNIKYLNSTKKIEFWIEQEIYVLEIIKENKGGFGESVS